VADSHVFAHLTDEDGLYHREVRLEDDGSLVIIGHDLGETEYEFERRVPPEGVRRLLSSLASDSTERPLDSVRVAFTSTPELEQRLVELGIASRFWSRIG